MDDAHFAAKGNEMYQADYDRHSAILFLVGTLDLTPEEVAAARSALNMDPKFPLADNGEKEDTS